jgi:hypothetical protein
MIGGAMQFIVGHLVDAANISVEGKLNLMGIFQKIASSEFPCQLPCALVALFEADPFDRGGRIPVRIEFIDEDGLEMFRMEGMEVAVPDQSGHLTQTCNLIVNLRPLTLTKPGPYSFKVLVRDRLEGEIRLQVESAAAG